MKKCRRSRKDWEKTKQKQKQVGQDLAGRLETLRIKIWGRFDFGLFFFWLFCNYSNLIISMVVGFFSFFLSFFLRKKKGV
jgi:hypothetical protein